MCLLITACGDTEKSYEVTVNKDTLVFGRTNEISVQLDSNWRAIPADWCELQISGRNKHYILINVSDYDGKFDKKNDEILSEYNSKKDFRIESKSNIVVDEIPSLFISFEYTDGEDSDKTFLNCYFIPLKNKFIDIRVSAPEPFFDETYAEEVLDTLNIINKTDIPKGSPTKRPFFFPGKILKKMNSYLSKKTVLFSEKIINSNKAFSELAALDKSFAKSKDLKYFNKNKNIKSLKIILKYGFTGFNDLELIIDKSLAGFMVINYLAELDEKSFSVEKNISQEMIKRNKLSFNDIKTVYENYSTVSELEQKMRM